MFFNSNKEISRLRKEINRLLGKGMFSFLGLINLSPGQFWGTPTHADIIES